MDINTNVGFANTFFVIFISDNLHVTHLSYRSYCYC